MQQQGRCLQLRQLLSITMDEVQVFVLTPPLSTCRAESGEVSGRGSSPPGAQKSASSLKVLSVEPDITPILWYSPTRFSKKLVFPSREMFSMKSKGFSTR